MKLRIKGNTLRLRVSRPEVAAIARAERVEDATVFGPGPDATLRYVLETGPGDAVRARLAGARITVTLPEAAARAWASGDAVGLSGEQPLGDGSDPAAGVLTILVEKDFPCAGRGEAESADAFTPPGGAARC